MTQMGPLPGIGSLRWILLIGVLLSPQPSRSEEPPPPAAEESASLERLIQDYEATERELGKAREVLKEEPAPSERRRIESWIRELELRQQERVDAIERKAGPLPPAVRDPPTSAPEKRLDSQRIRDEAVLEKDVERRLPR